MPTHVDYGFDALQNCQCGSCPVHAGSQCIVKKTNGLKFTTCSSTPEADEVEAIYCSAKKGRSTCSDLPRNKACLCPTCSVWRSHGLDTNYFCVEGPA